MKVIWRGLGGPRLVDSTGLETEGVLLVLPGVRNALQQPLEVEIGGLLSVQDGFDDVGGEEGKVEDAGGRAGRRHRPVLSRRHVPKR